MHHLIMHHFYLNNWLQKVVGTKLPNFCMDSCAFWCSPGLHFRTFVFLGTSMTLKRHFINCQIICWWYFYLFCCQWYMTLMYLLTEWIRIWKRYWCRLISGKCLSILTYINRLLEITFSKKNIARSFPIPFFTLIKLL